MSLRCQTSPKHVAKPIESPGFTPAAREDLVDLDDSYLATGKDLVCVPTAGNHHQLVCGRSGDPVALRLTNALAGGFQKDLDEIAASVLLGKDGRLTRSGLGR